MKITTTDARLKAMARKVVAGEIPTLKIPAEARLMHKRIGFLKNHAGTSGGVSGTQLTKQRSDLRLRLLA